MNRLIQFWSNLRSSFWFMPSLMVAGSIAFAVVLIEPDSVGNERWLGQWPRLFGAGAEGARQMLSTLAGSMMTVMGITFSVTLLALVLASSQYTSRILRNFLRSRITQFTLGAFAGIFTYCLIVLRTIRGGDGVDEFVPSLAVFIAFVMALGGVGVLIYYLLWVLIYYCAVDMRPKSSTPKRRSLTKRSTQWPYNSMKKTTASCSPFMSAAN